MLVDQSVKKCRESDLPLELSLNSGAEIEAATRKRIVELENIVRSCRSTIDNALEGIIRTSREGKFISANPAFARMLAYESPQEMFEMIADIGTQIYVEQDVRLEFLTELDHNGHARCEYHAWKKDGSTTWLLASSRIVTNDNGDFLYYESIVEDVFERRQREEQLAKLAESLAHSNTELKRFAHSVAHDISQPLCTIQSYCELLAEECAESLNAEGLQYIDTIIGASTRMRAVIKDILELSQVESNPLETEKTNLNVVLAEVLQDLDVSVREAGAEIICGTLPWMAVDRPKIRRLFQNLLSNSIKFRRGKSLKISISCFLDGNEWVFLVRDNGIGFDKKNNARVFEMFSRLTSPKQYPGSGMGLALCKRIVEAHGGRIWANSTPGVGTNVQFVLPATPATASS